MRTPSSASSGTSPDAQARRRGAGAAVRDVRAPAGAPLAEEPGRSVVAQHPARVDPFVLDRLEDHVAERVAPEPRHPRDVDAESGERDRKVRFGPCEPQCEGHPEPELSVFARIEERHRLAEREDGHAES